MKLTLKKIIAVFMSAVILSGMNLVSFAESENSWKNKIDEEIYEKITDTDTKVPVYIWLTDVDHEDVIADTEETLGYGEEDLAVIDENFSDELAFSVSSLSETDDESVSDELAKYLKKTEKKRKAEKEKTDKYIEKKREKYRDKYNEKSKDFLEKAKISDEDIIFRSQYTPMIIAELTEKQIKKVAKSDEVSSIILYEVLFFSEPSIEIGAYIESTKISDIKNNLNLYGENIKIGIVEGGNVTSNDYLPTERIFEVGITYSNPNSNHVQNTAKILAGNNGVASKSLIYTSATFYTKDNSQSYYEAIEELLNAGVVLINSSFGYLFHYDEYSVGTFAEHKLIKSYTVYDKWVDHVVSVHNVSFIVSAGNDAENGYYTYNNQQVDIIQHRILAPGNACNVITVGACDTKSNNISSDDVLYTSSSYDEFDSVEKPDIVGPAEFEGGGTSSSAPFVSGIIALMIDLRPSLAAYPHIIKAILLASCHHKASSTTSTETMAQGITDKQGAGVVDVYCALSITGRSDYGVRSISAGTTNADVKFNVPFLYGATGINVSIAWLRNNTISGSHNDATNANAGDLTDLNLSVMESGSEEGSSALTNSSTEMVYVSSPVAGTTYTARINRTDSSTEAVKVAYAWSFDNEQFQYTGDFEGVYFIKNKQSGNYLNYASSTGYTQKTFLGTNAQKWIIWKNSNGYYTIKPFSGDTGCLDINSLVSGKYYSMDFDSSDVADVAVQMNNDGSVNINNVTGGSQYLLSVLNNSTSANAQIVWKKVDSDSDMESSQNWYLEPICYQVGDIDMNGQITAADSRTVLNYSSGTESYGNMTNIKEYLSDANSDGIITAADSRLILRFVSGLE